MLIHLCTPQELEQLVCGSKELDFEQLKKATKYMKPLTKTDKIVDWFWDITIKEFDDDQRRKVLTFATGSDRAPITGL